MSITDLRDFLDLLEEHDELQRIRIEIDWNLEMGAITRRCYDLGAPAALFENVKGYPKGFRALGAPLGASRRRGHSLFARTALALGMGPSASAKEIMVTYLERKEKQIKPITVKSGPSMEKVILVHVVRLLQYTRSLLLVL